MEIVSLSPLRAASLIWQPRRGSFALTVVCKATFVLAPVTAELAPEQEYPNEEENHWNDDPARSVYSPCDLVPLKPRAEVTLVGHAFAPRGERVRSLVARMIVGDVDKSVEVVADRSFSLDGALREGPPFSRIPLRYERAAGGPDTANPVGVRADVRDTYGTLTLPNVQPPGLSVTSPSDYIAPVGFGPIAAGWPTRREKLGPHAGQWSERALATEPPERLDVQFFMAAPADQQLGALRPDERIVLEHLLADHPRLVTSLPGIEPRAFAERPGAPVQELELLPDTLWIDTDRSLCTLTWRGQLPIEHPAAAGRILVATAEVGRPLSWAEVEAEARRGPARARPRQRPIQAVELLPDDDRDTPPPTQQPDDGRGRGSSPALPFTATLAPSFAGATARLPRPGETIDMVLPGGVVERSMAAAAADKARKLAGLGAERARLDEGGLAGVVHKGDASPAWLRTPLPPGPEPSAQPPAPAPRLPAPPVARMPVPLPPPFTPQVPLPAPPVARLEVPQAFAMGETPKPPPQAFSLGETAKPLAQGFKLAEAPKPLTPVTASPAPPEGAPRPPLVSGEAAKLGAAAASNAAAASAAAPTPKAAGEAAPAAAPARPRELLDLLWFEPTLAARLRASRAFRDLLAPRATSDAWITAELPPRDAQAEQAERDRRDVLRVIVRAEPLDAARIDRALEEAFDEDGAFSPPLAVASGELTFRFDEREALKATVTAVSPLIGSDKKLRELVAEATEALKGEWPLPDDVAEGFTRRIEQGFSQAARAVGPGYLQGSVDKLLLESRQYRKKSVFSEPRIRAELVCAGPPGAGPSGSPSPIPTYLPVALALRLPLFSRFRALMIVELRTQEDQHETHPEALLVLAIARALKERRSS